MNELLKRRIAWLEDSQARMVRRSILMFAAILLLMAITFSFGPQQVPQLFDAEATPYTRMILAIRVSPMLFGLIAYFSMLLLELRAIEAESLAAIQTLSRLPTSKVIELTAQVPKSGRRLIVKLLWGRGVYRKDPMALAYLKGDDITHLPDGRGMEWNDLSCQAQVDTETSSEKAAQVACLLMILGFLAPLLLGAWEFWRSTQVLQGNRPYEALSPIFRDIALGSLFVLLGIAMIITLYDSYKRDLESKRKLTFDDRLNQWLSGDWGARFELRQMAQRSKQCDPQVLAARDRLGLEKSKDPGLRDLWPLIRKSDKRPPLESQVVNPASE